MTKSPFCRHVAPSFDWYCHDTHGVKQYLSRVLSDFPRRPAPKPKTRRCRLPPSSRHSRGGLPPDHKPAAVAFRTHHVIPAADCPQTTNPPPSPSAPITSFPRRRESGDLRAVRIHRNTRNHDRGTRTGRLNPLNCSAYRWYDVW